MPTTFTASFKDKLLRCPGYSFQPASPWRDTGSATLLCEGINLKDGSRVFAKIAAGHSNGSLCLERESHILSRLSSVPESTHIALKLLETLTLPADAGDAVVLILSHPGTNALRAFFPPDKINDLLLAGTSPAPVDDVPTVTNSKTGNESESGDSQDVMDISSFLEFAIQASRCLEIIHKAGLVHREIRVNAFHLSLSSGVTRLVHWGNRSTSLEQLGGPSALVLKSATDAMDDEEKFRIREALCSLAPEQTSSTDNIHEDHRTDLYSLGIVFWMLLVGNGRLPFDGPPMELLHSIVQRRPMAVHECRRDVSSVIGAIIDKLLAKNPDERYNSATGLKYDLLECQKRLNLACATPENLSLELISPFEIARQDKFHSFILPSGLFGRERELELIGEIIRDASTTHMRYISAVRLMHENPDSSHSSASQAARSPEGRMHTPLMATPDSPRHTLPEVGTSTSGSVITDPSRGRRERRDGPRAVVVHGHGGIGKSALLLSHQVQWRRHGLWAHAKFQDDDSTPFASILAALSSVLRQLMAFETDLHRFTTVLQARLGPQLQNLPLLFQGAPELKDLFDRFDIPVAIMDDSLSTEELRVRFQSLLVNVVYALSEVRMLALFLDDLHVADESTLDFVTSLIGSCSNVLILASFRDEPTALARMRGIFPDALWIALQPLSLEAVSAFVSRSLRRHEGECASLAQFLHRISKGNAFSVRNTLLTLQRAGHIMFNAEMNDWRYSIQEIEESFRQDWTSAPGDMALLVARLHAMPPDARRYLVWAALFGTVFKVSEVANVMDREDGGLDPEIETLWSPASTPHTGTVKSSARGLHSATAEGWLVQRARDMCSWTHDRYKSAVLELAKTLPQTVVEGMSLRVVLMLMQESERDTYRIAEFARRCTSLLAMHPARPAALQCLLDAAFSASSRGALEIALSSYISAKSLLSDSAWLDEPTQTFAIYLKIVELMTWKGDHDASDFLLTEMFSRVSSAEDQARVWRARSRNALVRRDFTEAVDNICRALSLFDIQLRTDITMQDTDDNFDMIKGKILATGQEHILSAPRCVDVQVDLCVALLNDAGTAAYWTGASAFMTSIGLTILELMFKHGISSGTALGFFWILCAAAEERELYRFSIDIAHLGLRLAATYGNSLEKSRAEIYYVALASGYSSESIRTNKGRCESAFKLAHAAGDRIYAGFAKIYQISNSIFCSEDLGETLIAVEAMAKEAHVWSENSDISMLAKGLSACVHALLGHTDASSASTVMATAEWNESGYLSSLSGMNLHWYACFKIACLYCLGQFEAAVELGYDVYANRKLLANHRTTRYALFWHSLALVQVARHIRTTERQKQVYLEQIDLNQAFIRSWQAPSPVNSSTWLHIIEAEVAALNGSSEAYRLYDVAVRVAGNLDWVNEEGWALFLQGSHFVRNGVEGLGREIQRRAITRQSQWGANGIVNYMVSALGTQPSPSFFKRRMFTADAGVQADPEISTLAPVKHEPVHAFVPSDDVAILEAEDLRSILKATQIIASDINLSLCLERLTAVAADICHAHFACVVMRTDEGEWALNTSMVVPQPCTSFFENPVPLRTSTLIDPLCRAVLQHTLNVQEPLFIEDVAQEPRFASEASYGDSSGAQSLLCVPMMSNRGQTFGAIYLSSSIFTPHDAKVLGLLMSQSAISISNALLFRSLQQATRGNLKAISAHKAALEETRRSREDALNATRIKSNFLASMSHELRTPFSSFYGLLDILSETALDASQRDIVATAKQSCELLLKIIDGILDYSKLEASAVKLEISPCSIEDLCADCMELVMPLAAQKLALEHTIQPDVPPWVMADDARIRQVLMNLLGNAIKFTASGSVTLSVSVGYDPAGKMILKCAVADTGIGLTNAQIQSLFVPFQQADNSSTRRFGGTGLGLSISKNLATLMNGTIEVQSQLGAGSTFTFCLPVEPCNEPISTKAVRDLDSLRHQLQQPVPPRILVCSPSTITLDLLGQMLKGFFVKNVRTIDDAEHCLRRIDSASTYDFVLVDHLDESRVEGLVDLTRRSKKNKSARIVHLYTPVLGSARPHHLRWTNAESPTEAAQSPISNVIRLSKPPRTTRLLGALASLKLGATHTSAAAAARASSTKLDQTLFGNVLVAEDNDVARTLLVKQLSRYDLNVQAAANGQEAIAAWQARDPGYFAVALFDHHMPIMDGVEATKQIRILERRNDSGIRLPIIALSADCQTSTQALCLSAGMNGFLAKPLRKNDLASLLTKFWIK
ncbi:hypothetical protein BKA62DRAFT_693063 [Auriculariales sp. MPI-PUGE-AT-0066]|nr:hypothetical protein BKA62DRAFT_693063 [Auriculariales sp. MPI-PUGE-AT-0066]